MKIPVVLRSNYRLSFQWKRGFSILDRVADPSRSKRVAIVEPSGTSTTYDDLHKASSNLADEILSTSAKKPATVACLHFPGASYVISSLAAWKLGAALVPLSPLHTTAELDYFLSDSDADIILYSKETGEKVQAIKIPKLSVDVDLNSTPSCYEGVDQPSSKALIIYTSGTTGMPKGVIHTHESLNYMIQSLNAAWEYSEKDRILHFLPLHHLHGILNKLWCVLYVGGVVEFLKSANALEIWKRISNPSFSATIFMAVPTIYAKMLELYEQKALSNDIFQLAISKMSSFRIMVSGSASLPISILRRWNELTGHHLLERYGMTEVGMALSNPLHGVRKEGFVGSPLPFVECKIVHDPHYLGEGDRNSTIVCGELLLKGKTLFHSYHRRPEETRMAFDENGWFKTGDIALRHSFDDTVVYRILGRNSTDIIKSAGFKLSALEIERELLTHPMIRDVTVLGLDDEMFGQIVAAIVVLRFPTPLSPNELQMFLKSRIAPYKVPRVIKFVDSIPKNQLGKVNKKTIWSDLKLSQ